MARTLALLLMAGLVGCGGRTEIGEDLPEGSISDAGPAPEPFEAECGELERFTQPGRPIVLEVNLSGGAPVVRQEWRTLARPEGATAEIAPTTGPVTGLDPDVVGTYRIAFEAADAEGDEVGCEYEVVVTEEPPVLSCPDEPLAGPIGTPLEIRGPGDRVFTWEWGLVSAPPGADVTLEPRDARTVYLEGDLDGPYVLEVTGYGADGASDTCQLQVQLTGAPEVECPDEVIEAPTRRPTPITAEASDDNGLSSVRWEVLERPEGSTAAPMPDDARTTRITPDRVGDYLLEFTATDVDGLEASCEVRVQATPTPPDALCPDPVETRPLETVELSGGGVDDGEIVAYRWEVTRRPAGSSNRLPSPDDERDTSFVPDVAGEYVLELTVTDDDGETGSCDVLVTALAQEGLRVEIYWNGPPDRSCGTPRVPGCDATDVDVHLLRPGREAWFDDDGDCYWFNCNAMQGHRLNWFTPAREDDPRLDLDDVEGFGPENINIDEPAAGVYRVGVDFWDGDGSTTADVVVNIYCSAGSSEPVASFGPVTLRDRRSGPPAADNDFWRVADVEVRDGGRVCQVTDLSRSDGSPNIITHEEARTRR
ncbi:MAG: PKD domain-containing protein [Myxococcota bacterium]